MISPFAVLDATPAPTAASPLGFDPTYILLFGLIIVVVIFMWRSSRRRRQDAEKLRTQMVPGVEVMTQTGIYGTIVSIDEDKNEAVIETTPGTKLRIHRQAIARVVEPDDVVTDEEELEAEAGDKTPADDPKFGERTESPKPKRSPRKKPTE